MNKTLKIVLAIVLCELAGFIGSIFTTPSIPTWYASLIKPSFSPPNWIFGPVWTTLFALMGVSLYFLWEKREKAKTALVLFSIQLVLNVLWSILFFGLKNPTLALIEIAILWIFILITALKSLKISKLASGLFIPYLLWVSFASFLNLQIVLLN